MASKTLNFDDKLGAIFGMLIGLAFIAGGLWVRGRDATERATLVEAPGTVVDTVSRREHDNSTNEDSTTYAPVIEFLASGDRTRITGEYVSSRASNGNPVVVRYDPARAAASARVVDPLEGLTGLAMFALGGFAALYNIGVLLNVRGWLARFKR